MTHPGYYETVPYIRIAFYATRRCRIWLWPELLRRRFLLAALDASDRGPKATAIAAIQEATLIMDEQRRR